jgi:hypothetical protein
MPRPIVTCMPVNCDDPHSEGDGYKKTICEECGDEVWIGPRQQQMRIVLKAIPLCSFCCVKAAKKQGYNGIKVKNLEDYPKDN